MKCFIIIYLIILLKCITALNENKDTLVLVHVMFRHGERYLEKFELYPNDQYKNETFHPYGHGQLTNRGEMTMYNLGKYLRKRYEGFLSEIYSPDIISSFSSNFNRSRSSLELVLKGLFATVGSDNQLISSPILFNYTTTEKYFFYLWCSNYQKAAKGLYDDDSVETKEIFSLLTQKTGWTINNISSVSLIYNNFWFKQSLGLKLPEWCKPPVYPDMMEKISLKNYKVETTTNTLRKFAVGTLLSKIINSTLIKISEPKNIPNMQMFLYSGHEFNIANLLNYFNQEIEHIVPFGSSFIMEVHKINETFGFKMFYRTSGDIKLLEIPKCGHFCTVDQFNYLVENDLSNDYEDLCENKK